MGNRPPGAEFRADAPRSGRETLQMCALDRLILALAGLFGAGGVITAALAAHGGSPLQETAALFLMLHAAALAGLTAIAHQFGRAGGPARLAALLLAVGVGLFAGDLLARHATGDRLLPLMAPVGGSLTVAGWLALALAALRIRPPPALPPGDDSR